MSALEETTTLSTVGTILENKGVAGVPACVEIPPVSGPDQTHLRNRHSQVLVSPPTVSSHKSS